MSSPRTLLRAAAALAASVVVAAGIAGCAGATPEADEQVAYDVLVEVAAMQQQDPRPLEELGYKTPAGVVLYTDGLDAAEPGDDPDPRYIVVVVNLSDGVVFVQQHPRGRGIERYESLEAYTDDDWREHAVSRARIPSLTSAYAANVDRAQAAHYAEFGRFAATDELLAYSADPANSAPDLGLPEGYRADITADANGYITLVTTTLEERPLVVAGYGREPAGWFFDGPLTPRDDVMLGRLVPVGDGTYRAEPLPFVTPDPADLDEHGLVLAVDLPSLD